MSAPSSGFKVIAAFAAIYIIWGSTYFAILLGLESFPPFMLASVRFLLSWFLLWAWLRLRREDAGFSLKSLGVNAWAGILMLAGGTGAVIWAEKYIASGLAAIVVCASPFWFLALDYREWRNNFTNIRAMIGLAIGFAGILILFNGSSESMKGENNLIGISSILMGGFFWSVGSLASKYRSIESPAKINALIQLGAAGVFCALLSLFLGEHHGFKWSEVSLKAWGATIYLATFGLVAYIAYLWLISVRSMIVVSTYAYVNPIVALLLGTLFAGEPLVGSEIIALGVILSGVFLVKSKR